VEPKHSNIGRLAATGAVVFIVALTVTSNGREITRNFLASLRIAKPQTVSASVTPAPGAGGTRPLQGVIGGMIAKNITIGLDEPDQSAPTVAAAAKLAGFDVQLPRARTDAPTFSILGAHAIEMVADRTQLRTIFSEAGRKDVAVPESVDGAKVAVRTSRAVRAQYGNCPVPVANTIQGQIQGPPSPSTDNANCVVLIEGKPVSADVPAALDIGPLMELALELSGMSPAQTHDFQQVLDWKATLAVTVPRNLRSLEVKDVKGARAMLLITAGRRGPTWAMVWSRDGMVYALTGYGNAGDAEPLANSIN
jgi:hypothetical protein